MKEDHADNAAELDGVSCFHDRRFLSGLDYLETDGSDVVAKRGWHYCDDCGKFFEAVPSETFLQPVAQQRQTTQQADADRRDKSKKRRYDLIPPEVLEALAEVYASGAVLHGDHNWLDKPYTWVDRWASAERHSWDWRAGHDLDPDGTGLKNAEQALWNWACLVTYIRRGIGKDDRKI